MASITECLPDYEGSIGIDKTLLEAAGIIPGERVHVLNFNNTQRFETYTISGAKGEISLRGPAAKLGRKGDKLVIIAYAYTTPEEAKTIKPKILLVNQKNEIK